MEGQHGSLCYARHTSLIDVLPDSARHQCLPRWHLLTWGPLQGLYVEECKQLTRLALQSTNIDSVALGGCPSLNQLTLRCPNLQMLDLQYGPCCSKAMHVQCCPCPANYYLLSLLHALPAKCRLNAC